MDENSSVCSAQENQVHLDARSIHCRNDNIILTDNAGIECIIFAVVGKIHTAAGNHISNRKIVGDLLYTHRLEGVGVTNRLSRRQKSLFAAVVSCRSMCGNSLRIQDIHIIRQILECTG